MSLLLRQACQTVLTKNLLGDYHTKINGNNYLQIVGECGSPLFTISGIEFNRSTPTAKEIVYAEELLTEFLVIHGADIKDLLLTKEALSKIIEIDLLPGYNLFNSANNANSYYINKITDEIEEDLTYRLNTNIFELTIQTPKASNAIDITLLSNIHKNTKIKNNLIKYAKLKQKNILVQEAFNDAVAKIQTCNI